MANNNNNVIKYRKPLNINIGMLIFAVIFIYTIICVFTYFTSKHIVPYKVEMGSLSTENVYKGLIMRQEEVINAEQAGYVNYYAREGSRVAVSNLVYTIDETGKLSDYLETADPGENSLSETDLTELKSEIVNYVSGFDPEEFGDVYDFKYDVKGTVLKLANANALENISQINSEGISQSIQFCRAPQTGIVVYSTDGMENLTDEDITTELFDAKNYEKTQLISNELVAVGDPVYKLAESEDWSLVIPMEAERAEELVEAEYIQVKYLKNQNISWGQVTSFTNTAGDTFVKLTFTNSMISFCTDRFLDVELITETEKGLKIPNSSIVEKEFFIVPKEYITQGGADGEPGVLREVYTEEGTASTEFVATTVYNETETEYYLDDLALRIGDYLIKPESTEKYALSKRGSLIGVYNVNKGYADFKQINILYQNDEYSIVLSNTQYGLSVYDYIVLDAATVNEDELVYE